MNKAKMFHTDRARIGAENLIDVSKVQTQILEKIR